MKVEVINLPNITLTQEQVYEMTRIQASTLLAKIRHRVHVQGIASDGQPIGNYSNNYALYTRPKYGRGTSRKVIASLTRSMENSMVLYPLPNGTGIGYATSEQTQKSKWVEKTYKKKIFNPTKEERNLVIEIGQNYIAERL